MARLLPFVCLLALFGCAASTAITDINLALSNLKGRHVDDLVQRIGFPDGDATISGTKVYTWGATGAFLCSIKVRVDDAEVIQSWQVDGYPGNCQSFANQLKSRI